jgi:hypothetical protein
LTDAEEAKKLRDARRFAKGLFYHVRGPCMRPYVVRDDFSPFFASKESADAAFSYFDKVRQTEAAGTLRLVGLTAQLPDRSFTECWFADMARHLPRCCCAGQ